MKHMKKEYSILGITKMLIICAMFGCSSSQKSAESETSLDDLYSVRMARSEMVRYPDLWKSDHTPEPRWGYHQGLMLKSMMDMYEYTGDESFFNYAMEYADLIITEDGNIKSYSLESYNIDNINAGKGLFYQGFEAEKFQKAIHLLRDQMKTHPRTKEGGFWHKLKYTHQMWLDGLYMGAPFLAQYAQVYNEPELFDDVVNQVRLINKYTYDPETSLFYHGWDESREQIWANKETGTSQSFWGRSVGWFAMALVDMLDFIPENYEGRDEITVVLQKVAVGIKKYQDEETGVWYQVLDQGSREGNYLESSASSMFVYALYKGVRKGYLDKSYLAVAEKGYEGILKRFIREEEDGTITITDGCIVAGLSHDRNGTFEYYIREKVRDNDTKAVVPFIWASIEHETQHRQRLAHK